jgi:hypothetical protein
MVVTLMVLDEMQEQLPARNGSWTTGKAPSLCGKNGLAASKRVLGRACMERDTERA